MNKYGYDDLVKCAQYAFKEETSAQDEKRKLEAAKQSQEYKQAEIRKVIAEKEAYYNKNSFDPYYGGYGRYDGEYDYHMMKERYNEIFFKAPVPPKPEPKKEENMYTLKEFAAMDLNNSAKAVESTISKEITSGISEEVIAYGLVHALSKQAEAIVGESELPLIKMTPSMLARIREHLETQLKEVKSGSWTNKEGKQKRLINFYESLIALTER